MPAKLIIVLLGISHMTSSKIQQDLNVILDNALLDRVSYTKFLGVLIDENLTWKCHIGSFQNLVEKRYIGIMNKLKYFVPDRILCTLYCASICLILITAFLFGGIHVRPT